MRVVTIFLTFVSAGCGLVVPNERVPYNVPTYITHHKHRIRHGSHESIYSTEIPVINFDIDIGGHKLPATFCGGIVKISHPDEWRSKARVIKFERHALTEAPFSASHCADLRRLASDIHTNRWVNFGYRIVLSFEVPPSLSTDLVPSILRSRNAAGDWISSCDIENPVDYLHGWLEIKQSDNAISRLVPHPYLYNELELSRNRGGRGDFEQQLITSSADVVCDLISGDLKMTMVYPIIGEGRQIRVIYGPMQVSL